MRVLVACEYSGRVRDAFRARGHDAMSCDLLESEAPGPHHRGDVRELLGDGWDLMVAHPPCTHLAVSGARWFKDKQAEQADALAFVRELLAAPIPRIALENPVSIISSRVRKPDQVIQPWQFGHGEVKATCLWLKGLPKLRPTRIVEGRAPVVHRMPPSPDRWKHRSRTYPGIAEAMAEQWGHISGVDAPAQAEPWQNRVAQRFAFDSGVSAMRDRAILAIEARHESGYDCTPTALVKAIRDAADPANPYGVREGVND